MKPPAMRSAFAISSLLLASGLPALVDAEMLFKGCYSKVPGLEDQGKYTYQSSGWCQNHCKDNSKPVFALWKGSHCLCGDKLPPKSAEVSKDKCSVSCDGWPQDMCGGKETYSVYLVDASDADSVSTVSSGDGDGASTTTTGGASATDNHAPTDSGGQAPAGTAASESQGASAEKSGSDSSSNTAAIAAGVVVGVVGFCALLGAAFLFWRFKKRRGQQNFVNTGPVEHYNKPMSTSSNSRFDGDFMAQRRQSNGSIDDDQDFSRRILQVTNPDR